MANTNLQFRLAKALAIIVLIVSIGWPCICYSLYTASSAGWINPTTTSSIRDDSVWENVGEGQFRRTGYSAEDRATNELVWQMRWQVASQILYLGPFLAASIWLLGSMRNAYLERKKIAQEASGPKKQMLPNQIDN